MVSSQPPQSSEMLSKILEYVQGSSGLSFEVVSEGIVTISQSIDGKIFRFNTQELQEVIGRVDSDAKSFIQVNFNAGAKILITDTLVGFKPQQIYGLDMTKIPKVVTTPDLLSVFEAIEESLCDLSQSDYEIEVLKKVFQAILFGGETAGFDLAFERRWLSRLLSSRMRASA